MNGKQLVVSTITTIVKVVALVIIVMFVYKWAIRAYDFGYRVFTEQPVSKSPGITYSVAVAENTTPKQVAQALQEYGLIRDSRIFYAQYLMSDYRGKFIPGTYKLNTAMTSEEMMAAMAKKASKDTGETTAASSTDISETETESAGTAEQ